MKLSKAQEKLFNRIQAVSAERKAGFDSRNEDWDGFVGSGYLGSVDFGWRRQRLSTVMALVKAGLISLRVCIDRHEERVQGGNGYFSRIRLERSYEFKLIADEATPSVEWWFQCAVDAGFHNGEYLRNEYGYSVYTA